MSNPRTMQIQEISAHPGPVAGRDTRREEAVCKYIDVTTCIGCKACEVACVEWNDHPFRETVFDNTYQTMATTEWNYYNLIKFNEQRLEMAHAQGSMHALRRSGLFARVPGRRSDRPVHERDRRFQSGQVHRVSVLRFGMPFRYSQVQSDYQESLQVHALY